MDKVFGIELNLIMFVLLGLLALSLAVVGWIAVRNMLLVRMGLRNAIRRPSQTILIVIGLMLSTLIMSAAFSTGDTVGYSVTNALYNSLGVTDFRLSYDEAGGAAPSSEDAYLTDAFLAQTRAEFGPGSGFDAIAGTLNETVPVVNPNQRLSEPAASISGVEPGVDAFKGLVTPDGAALSAAALGNKRAFISERLAKSLDARVNGELTVFVDNQPSTVQVIGIVRDTVISDPGSVLSESPGGGIVVSLEDARTLFSRPGKLSSILLSTDGGVRDALTLKDGTLNERLEEFTKANPAAHAEVSASKAEAIGFAELIGSLFVTFFLVFGLFSIAAGIMLIFLIFVMLAAERRAEMGMARAIGMKRMHLTESFIAEGMAYNIGSAAVGGLLGVLVAAGLIFVLGQIAGEFGLTIAFHFNPRAFIVAYSLGVVLTFITVTISAYRAANLNIVRAIRDIPEPQPLRAQNRGLGTLLKAVAIAPLKVLSAMFMFGTLLRLVTLNRVKLRLKSNAGGWSVWMILVGALLTWVGGWQSHQAFPYTGGVTLVILGVAMLAVYFGAAARPTFTIAGLALVWYWLLPLPFSLFMEADMESFGPLEGVTKLLGLPQPRVTGNIEMFFLSGICITAAATIVIVYNADVLVMLVSRGGGALGRIAPALKTAIAYPLASRFRTGMTLAMFGLVVFSLVVMSTLNANFSQLFAGEQATAGFDVVVEANPDNRIPNLGSALGGSYNGPEISGTGKLTIVSRVGIEGRQEGTSTAFKRLNVVSPDADLLRLGKLTMEYRAQGYASEADVLAALQRGEDVAVIDSTLMFTPGQFGVHPEAFQLSPEASASIRENNFEPVRVTLRTVSGTDVTVRVIGVLEPQITGVLFQLAGMQVAPQIAERINPGGDGETFFVTAASDSKADHEQIARGVESALLERGVQASSIREIIDTQVQAQNAFQYLFQGFMSLGLIVGIAALGVIAFRTVVERRQQIGMLRAIGYTQRLVALSFFLESSFIALAGIVMGIVLGGALSYNLMTSPAFTDGAEIQFTFPWLRILLICSVAYIASALMTLIPARAASRIAVAEALRYE